MNPNIKCTCSFGNPQIGIDDNCPIHGVKEHETITTAGDQPLSPKSSVGVEEKEEMIEKIKDKLFSIENWGENIIADEIYSLFASYSSLMNKEKDEQLRYCHKRMGDAYSEIDHLKAKVFAKDILNISLEKSETKLQQLLYEKEKEIGELKRELESADDTLQNILVDNINLSRYGAETVVTAIVDRINNHYDQLKQSPIN